MLEQEGGVPPLLWCPAIASCCKQHLRFADRRANGSSLHPEHWKQLSELPSKCYRRLVKKCKFKVFTISLKAIQH